MHQSMRRPQGIRSYASFEPGEDWFYDYEKQGMIKLKVWSCSRRTRIPKVSPHLDQQEGCQPTGNRS
jgi:hypothetical protein